MAQRMDSLAGGQARQLDEADTDRQVMCTKSLVT